MVTSAEPAPAVQDIPPLRHREAMALARTEYERMATLLAQLDRDDWAATTDCPPWTVRDLATHIVGAMRASSSVREQARQVRAAQRRGGPVADALSALQVEQLVDLEPAAIVAEVSSRVAAATRGRRSTPWPVRRWVRITADLPVGGGQEKWPIGFLVDTIGTRDTWLHRVDICRAVDRTPELTATHDGRLVADVVAEWARRHGQPFTLTLTGPAGGSYRAGTDGPAITQDAVEFCRALSGRIRPLPFETEVPF